MSKDIWHKPSEITDTDNNLIIKDFVNRTYEIGWFDDNDMIFRNFRNRDTYDEEGMMKWCDVDDIVNDYERLQNELDRTRKALKIAVDALKSVRKNLCEMPDPSGATIFRMACESATTVKKALEQRKPVVTHNKIEFPEYKDGLLEEFDKQFLESGQDDDLTETALEQKDK